MAPSSHQRPDSTPAAMTKNLPMKPAVSGIPASDSIITVSTAVRYGRRQNRPRYSYRASASRPP
ncbi:hypothetical protein D3C85_1718950 [compost metagenome]